MKDKVMPAPWRQNSDNNQEKMMASMSLEADDLLMQSEGDTLFVCGDVDLYQAPSFRARAEEHIRAAAEPRLDMSQVGFLDSAGLATLLYLSRQAGTQNKTLRLVVTGGPRRVLKITGIDRVLILED